MVKELGYTERMGPMLRAEVQKQLLKDFQRYYNGSIDNLAIDWSETCPEGHATIYLDSWLEDWSDVRIVNLQGEVIASGWIDFIHGGEDNPLFVFWYYLQIGEDGSDVVKANGIPLHIWERLPDSTKDLCLKSDSYDAAWCNDPLVLEWGKQRSRGSSK